MLKTLRRLYEESKHIFTGESDTRVSEEDMRKRAKEIADGYGATAPKRLPYRDRWKNSTKPVEKPKVKEPTVQDSHENAIKDECFICGSFIKKNRNRYVKQGNTCSPCNNRVDRVVKKAITHEEAMEELLLTRKI